MGFQISNDEETTSQSTSGTESTPKSSLSLGSDYEADDSETSQEDSVFIANQYQKPEDSDGYGPMDPIDTSSSVGAGTYLSQHTAFTPIVMYIGVALQIFALIYFAFRVTFIEPDTDMLVGMDIITKTFSVASVFSTLGGIAIIVDSILFFTKTKSDFSVILWAIFLPYVYFFKRFKINGDSSIIPIGITVAYIAVAAFTYITYRQTLSSLFTVENFINSLSNPSVQSNLIFLKSIL